MKEQTPYKGSFTSQQITIKPKYQLKKAMNFLTDEKLLIVGAAGMIGSNMAQQTAAHAMHLTPNICLYDPYAKGL